MNLIPTVDVYIVLTNRIEKKRLLHKPFSTGYKHVSSINFYGMKAMRLNTESPVTVSGNEALSLDFLIFYCAIRDGLMLTHSL